MVAAKRVVIWTKAASDRHDQTAFDIALQYGEQAAMASIEGSLRDSPTLTTVTSIRFQDMRRPRSARIAAIAR